MSEKRLNRRGFLKLSAMTILGTAVAACAQPAPTAAPTKPAAAPTATPKPAEPTKPAAAPAKYKEAPMLADLVKAGKLPPVDQRLPEDPLVLSVLEEVGQYGGTWRRAYSGVSDRWGPTKIVEQDFWEYNPDLSVRANVASKYEANQDASVWTIYLRKGMKWSDGQAFDTDDIAFFRDAVWKNKTLTPAPESDSMFAVGGKPMEIEIVDKYTFRLKFAKSNALLGITTWIWNYPEHYMKQYHPDYVSKDVLDKAVKDAGVDTWDVLWNHFCASKKYGWWVNPDLPVIWAWKCTVPPPAELIAMERNPYFWQVDKEGNQLPYIDKVTHRLFNSADVLKMWLINGEIDCQARHVTVAMYTLLKENEKKGDYRVLVCKAANTSALQPNQTTNDPVLAALFQNVDFRHAMSVAINRQELNHLALDLFEPRQACPVSGSPQFDAEWEKKWIEYDPAAANKLLDGLGLKWDASNKVRLRPDGKPLQIVMEYTANPGDPENESFVLIAKYLSAVGLGVTAKGEERSLYEARELTGDIQIGTWACDMSLVPMKAMEMYIGTMLDNPYMSKWGHWKNTGGKEGVEPPANHPIKQIWALWDQAQTAPSLAAATEAVKKLMDINREQIFQIGLIGEGPSLIVAKNNFRNVIGGIAVDDPIRDEHVEKDAQWFFKK